MTAEQVAQRIERAPEAPLMIERAVGGWMPGERAQLKLSELWRISLTALAGSGNVARDNRLQWVIDSFLKEHGHEPNVSHKWIYVWATDNLGTLTTGDPVKVDESLFSPPKRRRSNRGVVRRR